MPLQSKKMNPSKNQIAYLAALSILFSYAEILLPKIMPFFKLGLGNVIVLSSFELSFSSFLLLNLIRIIASAMLNGTLFSPFVVISLVQGFGSAIFMYALYKLFSKTKLMGIYGISVLGSALSAVLQILVSSLYIGRGTFSLLGPMLIFSVVSGLVTVCLRMGLNITGNPPELIRAETKEAEVGKAHKVRTVFTIIFIFTACALSMMISSIRLLCVALIFALIFQLLCHRKIFILPHLSLWVFILICAFFTPAGKVLIKLGPLSLTEGAVLEAVEKSLKLSIIMAISQGGATLRFGSENLMNLSLVYFEAFCAMFQKVPGNIIVKIKTVLNAAELKEEVFIKKGVTLIKAFVLCVIFILLFIVKLLLK